MLGKIQGHMPRFSYLVTRDRIADPLPVEMDHSLGGPLDPVLAEMRDRHLHIKHHGHKYLPWRDGVVGCNFANLNDAPWSSAKKKIAREHTAGGTLTWLPHVGKAQAEALATRGFDNLDSLLAVPPESVDFGGIGGIGDITAERIRAMLEAHRSGRASPIPTSSLPARADAEFFCDLEFFSNVHVDFDDDWPGLQGREMIFMIGVGWEEGGQWRYCQFTAERETREAERLMFEEFAGFLAERGALSPKRRAALYHWSHAEVWQSARAADRLQLPYLERLPWHDLREVFYKVPVGVPGAWNYGLKTIAAAVGELSPEHAVAWPTGLGEGLSAMVAGWRAYEQAEPTATAEMTMLGEYLEADCSALWKCYAGYDHSVRGFAHQADGTSAIRLFCCLKLRPQKLAKLLEPVLTKIR